MCVLVPAHNEEESIGATVSALWRQHRRPDRVLVVADNCTDATVAVALEHGAEVIESEGNTHKKAGALNQGLAYLLPTLTDDDFLLITDADSTLVPGFIARALSVLRRTPQTGAVCGSFYGREMPEEDVAGLLVPEYLYELWRSWVYWVALLQFRRKTERVWIPT